MRVYSWLDRLAALGLPAHCVLCGGRGSVPGLDLCQPCEAELPRLAHGCVRCGLPLPDDHAVPRVCRGCVLRPPAHQRCVAACRYEFPLTQLIPALKYEGALANARVLGVVLAKAVAASSNALPVDRIVPIPLHPSRLVERGFNQSHEIARFVSRSLAVPLEPAALRRTRLTAPQVGLPRSVRLENVRDAFAAEPGRVSGLRVALLDDVVTTGSTADSAARTLMSAGAARVDLWCVARAPGDSADPR